VSPPSPSGKQFGNSSQKYTINSRKLDYDLVKKYKQKVYEKIYFDYISSGTSLKSYKKFLDRWNEGIGVFEILDNKIDIRI
jgi:hypothetical protein